MHTFSHAVAFAVALSLVNSASAQIQTERFKLLNPGGQAVDQFGGAVDVDGDLIAVGGRVFGDNSATPGSVVIYNAATGEVVREFHADDSPIFDGFGAAIDLLGPLLVVGAPFDDANGTDAGAVYLFESDSGEPLARIAPPQAEDGDRFGAAVATNGEIVIVSAPLDNENGANAGRVYIFDISDPADPVQLSRFQHNSAGAQDKFGESLALQDDLAIIGAPGANGSGEVFMYNVDMDDPDSPTLLAELPRPEGPAARFGQSVAISDLLILVGTHNDGNDRGEAQLYEFLFPTNPVYRSTFAAEDDGARPDFGYTVAIDGDRAVIGAADDATGGFSAGSAYVFDVSDASSPVQTHQLIASDAQSRDYMGIAVAIDGDTVVAGAYGDDTFGHNSGSAYVFDIPLPCSQADLAEPLGVLDLADVVGFVTAFLVGDEASDMNGDGVYDLDDITMFINAFNAGCP